MAPQAAHLDSPEILKQFRSQVVEFESVSRQALDGVRADIQKVTEWLRREQLARWARELRKREEEVAEARSRYAQERHGGRYTRKPGCYDERKALEKAQRAKAEAEAKIRAVKRWVARLEQDATKLLQPCQSFSVELDSRVPRALNRLDSMLDNLDVYLRAQPPDAGD